LSTAKSDQEASETEAALEAENVDGRPIKPPRSDSMIDAEIVSIVFIHPWLRFAVTVLLKNLLLVLLRWFIL